MLKNLLLAFAVLFASLGADAPTPPREECRVFCFTAEWCGPCNKMKKESWPKPDVVAAYRKYQGIWTFHDDEGHPKHAECKAKAAQYGVDSLPTILIIGPDGKELRRHTGYATKLVLLGFLEQE